MPKVDKVRVRSCRDVQSRIRNMTPSIECTSKKRRKGCSCVRAPHPSVIFHFGHAESARQMSLLPRDLLPQRLHPGSFSVLRLNVSFWTFYGSVISNH